VLSEANASRKPGNSINGLALSAVKRALASLKFPTLASQTIACSYVND
jgi:hypothetical protein